MERVNHDGVLVVGAGLAGLSAALAAAPRKAPPGINSNWKP